MRWMVCATACMPLAVAQSGEDCSDAIPISGEVTIPFNNVGASSSTFTGDGACANSVVPLDRFFQWTATAPGRYSLHVDGDYNDSFLGRINVLEGVGCAAVCVAVGENAQDFGQTAFVTVAQAGATYLLHCGGSSNGFGHDTRLVVTELEDDTCEYPRDIQGLGVFPFNTFSNSNSGYLGSSSCPGTPAAGRDTFLRWSAPHSGDFRFDVEVSNILNTHSFIAVYEGSDCAAVCRGFEATAQGGQASVSVANAQVGDTFLIQLSGRHPTILSSGELTITSNDCALPDFLEPNDSYGEARNLIPGTYTGLRVASNPDVDFYKFVLYPGQVAYAQVNVISGGQVLLSRYAFQPTSLYTPPGLDPSDPILINNQEDPITFRLSVRMANGESAACSIYELVFDIGPDPCGYAGDFFPPATPIAPGLHAGLPVMRAARLGYEVVVAGHGSLDMEFPNGAAIPDLRATFWDGRGMSYGMNVTQVTTWVNPQPEPARLHIRPYLQTPNNVYFLNECANVDLLVSGGEALGSNYCSPGVINTSGQGGEMSAQGSPNAADNLFTLIARELPADQFGFFLGSQTQGFVMWPGGSRGHLCLGGAIARFNQQLGQISSDGVFARTIDITNIPEPPLLQTTVLAGQEWNFQLWHRDNLFGPASNFTDAVSVVFH